MRGLYMMTKVFYNFTGEDFKRKKLFGFNEIIDAREVDLAEVNENGNKDYFIVLHYSDNIRYYVFCDIKDIEDLRSHQCHNYEIIGVICNPKEIDPVAVHYADNGWYSTLDYQLDAGEKYISVYQMVDYVMKYRNVDKTYVDHIQHVILPLPYNNMNGTYPEFEPLLCEDYINKNMPVVYNQYIKRR
jgi:hypothetical protein